MCKGLWGDEMHPYEGSTSEKAQVKNLRNILSPSMSHPHTYSRVYSAQHCSLIPANDTINYLWVKLWGVEEHWTFQRQGSIWDALHHCQITWQVSALQAPLQGPAGQHLGGKGCSWDFLSAQGLSVERKELSPLTSSPALSLPTQHMSILLCPPALSSLLDFPPSQIILPPQLSSS